MKKFILINLLIIIALCDVKAQSEFGLEIGHHSSEYLQSTKNGRPLLAYAHIGLKAGFFWEKEVLPFLSIRSSAFYNIRYFDVSSRNSWYPYENSHCFSFPIKAILKAGKIVHFGLGIDPILLLSSSFTESPQFRIGPCLEMSFRIRKMMRLSFYCNYDFVPIELNQLPKMNNITLGVSFAFVFAKLKKRRVIYSPG